MESRVLKVLEAYEVSGGRLSVSGTSIQWVGNDGSSFYIDFGRPLIDVLQHGGSASAIVRTRGGW